MTKQRLNQNPDFLGLFYTKYWVIFPIENSIFFPKQQENIHNSKLQTKHKWIKKFNINEIKGRFIFTMLKWWKMSS